MVTIEKLVDTLANVLSRIWIFIYIGGIIWVVDDSMKMRKKTENKEGLHPGLWFVLCLFFWNFAVPIYWILRKPRNIWKSIGVILVFLVAPVVIIGANGYFLMQREAKVELYGQNKYEILKSGMTSDEVKDIIGMPFEIDERYNVETKMNIDIWVYAEEGEAGVHIIIFDVNAEPETLIDNIYYDSEKDTEINIGE